MPNTINSLSLVDYLTNPLMNKGKIIDESKKSMPEPVDFTSLFSSTTEELSDQLVESTHTENFQELATWAGVANRLFSSLTIADDAEPAYKTLLAKIWKWMQASFTSPQQKQVSHHMLNGKPVTAYAVPTTNKPAEQDGKYRFVMARAEAPDAHGGVVGCGYFDPDVAPTKDTDNLVTVHGVDNYDDLLTQPVVDLSTGAQNAGVEKGMTGQQALEILNSKKE